MPTPLTVAADRLKGRAKRHKEFVKRRVRTDVARYDEAVAAQAASLLIDVAGREAGEAALADAPAHVRRGFDAFRASLVAE